MDDMKPTLATEPATLTTAISAAIIATINVIGIIANWTPDLIAGLNIAAAGWVAVLGFWIRSKVKPVASLPSLDEPPEFP
jgi:hypothetical protein